MRVLYRLMTVCLMARPLVVSAAASTNLGAASGQLYERTTTDTIETNATSRVRIPVVFKGWTEVDTTGVDGKPMKSRIPSKPVSHVLRARMEQSNDFYVGDWRVQTIPVRWLRHSNQYQVKIEVFRRYGEAGQLEESMGHTLLTGILEPQADGLYLINGAARRSFRDREGKPLLDFEAGQPPRPESKPVAVSKMVPQK
jgi:hypothetical protein